MDFQEMQEQLAELHLDTRTTWILAGTNNKKALNSGYKEVYKKAIQDRSIQEIMKTSKTLVTVSDGIGILPDDFFTPVKLYTYTAGFYSELDKEDYPYRYQRISGGNNIIFDENPNTPIYIEYIPKLTELTNDTDESILPSCFDDDIINYAMVQYHRKQRDWAEVSNELQYAEGKLGDSIDNFWLE